MLTRLVDMIASLRVCVAILLCAAFISAPLAEASHVEAGPVELCETAHDDTHSGEEPPGHEGHDHHAHKCGGCHMHIYRKDSIADVSASDLPQRVAAHGDLALPPSQPDGLYRPPRA